MELDRTRKGAGERPGQPWEEARGEEETHAGCPKSASRPSMGRTDSSARRKSSDALWMTCCCYLQRDAEVRQATGAMKRPAARRPFFGSKLPRVRAQTLCRLRATGARWPSLLPPTHSLKDGPYSLPAALDVARSRPCRPLKQRQIPLTLRDTRRRKGGRRPRVRHPPLVLLALARPRPS